ncbi:conserved hypothetical protein [Methanocella paludicola SANAE]|uniref:Uncharacterized protein n=1 Tax=Methanocella paludicola (strain DSM 17711 / JCM 13418 / NBRC 101707 / SANAE) TaxID=304371 RepID=D1Z1R8_METPS|nr:hypothetical protein [Methanocella paludicola]BAI62640.1 conserved hypothetical protein [Methanocella paludicola SANAE]
MRRLRSTSDEGIAIAAEYVALLGISLLIFTAVFVGVSSFNNTASADARAQAAYSVAVRVSDRMSGAVESHASVVDEMALPERICGRSYLVYPSGDGRAVCVLVGREAYEAPLIVPGDINVEGFMVSAPGSHRIQYEASSKTLTLT